MNKAVCNELSPTVNTVYPTIRDPLTQNSCSMAYIRISTTMHKLLNTTLNMQSDSLVPWSMKSATKTCVLSAEVASGTRKH